MRGQEAVNQTNLAADSSVFELTGGLYGIIATATWNSGSFQLKTLAADGSTYVAVASALTADGYSTLSLPPGQYKWVKSGSPSAGYLSVARVPSE